MQKMTPAPHKCKMTLATPSNTTVCASICCLPWALLARTRRKLWVLRLVGRHGGSVDLPLSGLIRVHAERGVLPAVDSRLVGRAGGGGSGGRRTAGFRIGLGTG